MRTRRSLPLHYLLAAVLLLGSLPVPADAATMPEPVAGVTAGEQADSSGDCHGKRADAEAAEKQSIEHACCDLSLDCCPGHCGCLVLNLVIPVRGMPASHIPRSLPPASKTSVLAHYNSPPPSRPPKA